MRFLIFFILSLEVNLAKYIEQSALKASLIVVLKITFQCIFYEVRWSSCH